MFEIHYTIDGVRRWTKIRAKNKRHALSKLYAKHDLCFLKVNGVFHV